MCVCNNKNATFPPASVEKIIIGKMALFAEPWQNPKKSWKKTLPSSNTINGQFSVTVFPVKICNKFGWLSRIFSRKNLIKRNSYEIKIGAPVCEVESGPYQIFLDPKKDPSGIFFNPGNKRLSEADKEEEKEPSQTYSVVLYKACEPFLNVNSRCKSLFAVSKSLERVSKSCKHSQTLWQ